MARGCPVCTPARSRQLQGLLVTGTQRPGGEANEIGEQQRHLALPSPAAGPFGQRLPQLQHPQPGFPRRPRSLVEEPIGDARHGGSSVRTGHGERIAEPGSPGIARRKRYSRLTVLG